MVYAFAIMLISKLTEVPPNTLAYIHFCNISEWFSYFMSELKITPNQLWYISTLQEARIIQANIHKENMANKEDLDRCYTILEVDITWKGLWSKNMFKRNT